MRFLPSLATLRNTAPHGSPNPTKPPTQVFRSPHPSQATYHTPPAEQQQIVSHPSAPRPNGRVPVSLISVTLKSASFRRKRFYLSAHDTSVALCRDLSTTLCTFEQTVKANPIMRSPKSSYPCVVSLHFLIFLDNISLHNGGRKLLVHLGAQTANLFHSTSNATR